MPATSGVDLDFHPYLEYHLDAVMPLPTVSRYDNLWTAEESSIKPTQVEGSQQDPTEADSGE
jgi:hypothetical protein